MTRLTSAALALALLCASCGQTPTSPLTKSVKTSANAQIGGPPREGPPTPPNTPGSDVTYYGDFIRRASVTVHDGELVAVIISTRPMTGLGTTLFPQAYFDTDQDIATGYAISTLGCEFVARVIEQAADGRYPIVSDFGESGTTISGYGTLDATRKRLELRIPLSAMGDDDGAINWMVEMTDDGSFVGAALGSNRAHAPAMSTAAP